MSSRNGRRRRKIYSRLYQIGIRCLAATRYKVYAQLQELYQIGIRCLAATYICAR